MFLITIDLGTIEYYDGKKKEFVYLVGGRVRFEYTLKMIYEWESKWKIPFLRGGLTEEQSIDFYLRMALDPIEKDFMTEEVMEVLSDYIKSSETATTFHDPVNGQNGNKRFSSGKVHTAEELYSFMFMANVPIEFENRNLNRLLVTLRIINEHNSEPKKMDHVDVLRQNRELNEARKKKFNTKG